MHTKRKGNIGQLAMALFLAKHQYSVFTEQGDISKIDVIAEKDGKVLRFQCKSATPKNGVLSLPLKKSGPNYVHYYDAKDFDYFSLYDLENGSLYLIQSNVLNECRNEFYLRLEKPKNNQAKGINLASDFDADKVLMATN